MLERDRIDYAFAENAYLSAAVGTGEIAHVLHYAENRHVHHLSHVYGL